MPGHAVDFEYLSRYSASHPPAARHFGASRPTTPHPDAIADAQLRSVRYEWHPR